MTVPVSLWQAAWTAATPVRGLRSLHAALHARAGGVIAGSWAARHAEGIATGLACGVLLASPYVGTGANALLVLVAFAALVFQWLVTPERTARPGESLALPFLACLAASIVAVGFSPYPILSAKGLAKALVFWMSFGVFRGVLARGARGWVPLFTALFLAAAVQSLYGVYQWKIQVPPLALWDDADSEISLTRVYGTLKNPNLLSGYLVPILPFAAAAAMTWREPLRRGLALVTGLAGLACLYFTYSRGAYLGVLGEAGVFAFVGLWAWGPRLKSRPKLAALVGVGALVLVGVGALAFAHSPDLQQRVFSITQTRDHSSNSFRLNVWAAVKHMIRDSWWAGIGPGNDAFRKVYALYMVSGFEALGAYNIFLEEAVEKGMPGLLAFLWLVGGAIALGLRHVFRGVERIWAAAAMAALVGLMIHGMVDTVFYRPSVQILFWLVLAATIHLPRRREAV